MTVLNRRMRFRPYRRNRSPLPAVIAAAALLLAGAAFLISLELRPIVETVAVSKAENLISVCMSSAVDDCLVELGMDYAGFIAMDRDESGSVLSLSGRPAESNRFKKLVIDCLTNKLGGLSAEELEIPLGNLSGSILLSGIGPSVKARVYSIGDITATYSNTFSDAGVNQTHHCIYLNITATVHLLIPGNIIPVTVEDRICVAETIILGDVPDTYIQMDRGE